MTTITREHLEDEVLKSIQKKAESIMPKDAKVILFGSRARRDAKADSDWDILVLLNKDKIDEQDHDSLGIGMANQSDDSPDSVFDEGLAEQKGQSFL